MSPSVKTRAQEPRLTRTSWLSGWSLCCIGKVVEGLALSKLPLSDDSGFRLRLRP